MPSPPLRPICVAVALLVPSASAQDRPAAPVVAPKIPTAAPAEAPGEPAPEGFAMAPAVACLRVEGYERYTPLPEATLTSADKLKVYFRPLRYKVETDLAHKSPYRVKFAEDGRIRRKGEKTVLAREDKLLEYETRYEEADYRIYLANTIGLENFPPGDYELDITLHDLIDGTATARQTLPFKIIPSAAVAPPAPAEKPAAPPAPTPAKSKKSARSTKRPG